MEEDLKPTPTETSANVKGHKERKKNKQTTKKRTNG
jgi:hypothetical protein